ncbi:FctA domain-containing protein [Ruminococcus sp.]|uniref:Spy0128 family protein n=1 Tax=Ruminococcus sp. TaxID=41978 RepID=UPI0025D53850|nr:FctA domain-containing protein [Ruminococcus sp.]MBQ8965864.1 NPXTG-anchored protein [Ruminococcus sp.]
MEKSTHRKEYRFLAGLLSLVCLFSVVFGSVPEAFAASAEYPENIELVFNEAEDENIKITDDGKTADYTIPELQQRVNIQLKLSLNKRYENGQLRIEIPSEAFSRRDGDLYSMDKKYEFINQAKSDSSLVNVENENYTRVNPDGTRESGIIVLSNKAATAPQITIDMAYLIYAFGVEDNASQDFGIRIVDTITGEERSPDDITATFRTHVRNASLSKYTESVGVKNGCYYKWDDSLESRYALTSKYGIDEAKFTELCNDYDFVGYRLSPSVQANQDYTLYLDEQPEGGEVVAVSRLYSYSSNCIPLEKETEGPYAGQWKHDGSVSNILVLVKYPKSVAESADGGSNPDLVNNAKVTYVGVDGDEEDVAEAEKTLHSVWQDMSAVYHGDIWSVEKDGYPDPSGGLDLLQAGSNATFTYRIKGIGRTYKYGMIDNFEYKNGPYWMELVDDALYVNGLGEYGTNSARLEPDDFYFKTFTAELYHKDVTEVTLDGEPKTYTYRKLEDRQPIEVYVMTADKPDEWQLDQKLTTLAPNSQYTYADENGNSTFKFKHDRVYRIKFTYRDANGDIELVSVVTGELRGEGPTVKKVLANMKEHDLANFQLFNWDGQMGYNAAGVWENPTDGKTISTDDSWVKEDLLALDAQLYEGHSAEADNVQVATRLHAQNNLVTGKPFCGAAKQGSVNQRDGKIYGTYKLGAVAGRGGSPDDVSEMVKLGMINAGNEVVYHELLPIGMSLMSVRPIFEGSTQFDFQKKNFSWETLWYQYSANIHFLQPENEPEITIETIDNYKGSLRQMAVIKVKYPELPVIKMGEHTDICYAVGSVIEVKTVADYADIRNNTLDNVFEAQFIGDDGKALELKGQAALPDDGSVFEEIKGRDGENVFKDIDEDGDTTALSVVAFSSSDTITIYQSGAQLDKKIKADDYDTYFKDYTQTYAGHNYTYRIRFYANDGVIRNVVLFDSIEEAYNEEKYQGLPYWKGTLYGVDLSEAKDSGFEDIRVFVNTGHFYTDEEIATNYSTGYKGLQPDDLTAANGWQEIDPDNYDGWADVKTIAFSIGEDVRFGKADDLPKSVSVYLKMTAPDTIHEEQTESNQVLAYNAPAFYSEKLNTSGWTKDTTIANVVTIGLKSATAEIPAITKTLTGEDIPGDFSDTCTFKITPVDGGEAPRAYADGEWGDEISSVKVSVNAAGPTAVADDNGSLFFTEPQTREFEITEVGGRKTGVNYSKAKYKVVYTVEDTRKDVQYDEDTLLKVETKIYKTAGDDGKALAGPIEVESIEFVNSYAPVPAELELPAVKKTVEGADRPEEKEFTFMLEPFTENYETAGPLPEDTTAVVKGEGTAKFGKMTFDKAGIYEYAVYEVSGGQTGYTYDDHTEIVRVTVFDNKGQLDTTVEKLEGDTYVDAAEGFEFVNEYTPNPTDTVSFPQVTKRFSGQPRLDDKEFSFTLTAKNGAPLPKDTNVTVEGAGRASFCSVKYTKAGTYTYTITEDDFDESYTGYTRDESVYTYTVTVTDNDGQLEASAELTKNGDTASAAIFVNDYTPVPTSIVPPVAVKQIKGDTHDNDPKVFSFELRALDEAPVPERTVAKVTGEGMAQSFGRINYTEAGTYVYEINEKELPDTYVGYTRDTALYTYTVTVTDNSGKLKAEGVLTKDREAADALEFVNTYTPVETSVEVPVAVKQIDGDTHGNEDKTFTFELTSNEDEAEDIPMPENTTATATGSGEATPFGAVRFTDVGTYHYAVTEKELDDTHTGYSRDESVYEFTVTVTDVNGKLTAEYEITKGGETVEVPEFVFVNEYKPEETQLELPAAVKQINGDTQDTEDREFTFLLTDAEDYTTDEEDSSSEELPMPDPAAATVKGSGQATPFGKITFTEPGVYRYAVIEQELNDTHAGYTRDGSVYIITVTVTDNDGKLEASYVMTKSGREVSELVFVNDYVAESCELELPVAVKKIDGIVPDEEDKTFTFELTSAEDELNPMPENATATVTGEGKATAFGKITYTRAGTYHYDVFEQDLDDSYVGYSKDTTVYRLTVTVKDMGGKLEASCVITKDGKEQSEPVFVNSYNPRPLDTDLDVIKVIEGATPEEDEIYTFEITAKDGAPLPENNRLTITGDGSGTFDSWTYTEAGVYVYEVREIAGDSENCTYDDVVYTITDTVTDMGGELKLITVKDGIKQFGRVISVGESIYADVEFVNVYEEEEEETTKPEDDSSEQGGHDDSSSIPHDDSSSQEQTTSGDSSGSSESSESSSESSSSSDKDSSSQSSSSGDSSKSSSSKSDSSRSTTTTQTSSNPNTGAAKTLVGFEIVMLGAAIVVLKKRKDNKED